MFNIGVDGQLMIGALGATLAAFALQGQVPAGAILILSVVIGDAVRRLLGVHPRVPQGADGRPRGHHDDHAQLRRGAGRASSPCARTALRAAGQHGSRCPSPCPDSCDIPLIIDLPADPPGLGLRRRAADGGRRCRWLLFRTTKGFELRASGFNLTAARYAGMSAGGSMMLAMALSGALAGLGGLVPGDRHRRPAVARPVRRAIGFNAIALALLAGYRPGGVVLAALLFGALTDGRQV